MFLISAKILYEFWNVKLHHAVPVTIRDVKKNVVFLHENFFHGPGSKIQNFFKWKQGLIPENFISGPVVRGP